MLQGKGMETGSKNKKGEKSEFFLLNGYEMVMKNQ
jgi:hypothetical protein